MGAVPEQIVVFRLANGEYGVPIGDAKEIIPYVRPRSLGNAHPMIVGVISLRGDVIPVCDLSAALGFVAGEAHGNIVVVETGGLVAGILVERVVEVRRLEDARVTEVSGNAVVQLGERLIVLLAPAGLLAPVAPARAKPKPRQRVSAAAAAPARSRRRGAAASSGSARR